MKNLILIVSIPLLLSCQKDKQVSANYTVDTKILVSLNDKSGVDLLEEMNLDNIELVSFGKEGEKPLPYEIDITLEPISPEVFFYRPAKENNGLSSIELHLLYTNPTSTTVIKWNNGLSPDTLRGNIVYEKKKHRVSIKKLFLNDQTVWTDKDGDDRYIIITKDMHQP